MTRRTDGGARAPTVRLVGGGVREERQRPAPLVCVAPGLARTDRDGRSLDLVAPILGLTLGERVGWALHWDDDHVTSGVLSLTDADGQRPRQAGPALVCFRQWLGELLDLSQAILVGYEALLPWLGSAPLPGGHCQLHLEGLLLARLEGRVDYVAPTAEEVRASLLDRPDAPRRFLGAVRARWNLPVESDEEARALAVLAWVVDVLGEGGAR